MVTSRTFRNGDVAIKANSEARLLSRAECVNHLLLLNATGWQPTTPENNIKYRDINDTSEAYKGFKYGERFRV
jgi:hypothetical protein